MEKKSVKKELIKQKWNKEMGTAYDLFKVNMKKANAGK